MKQIAQNYKSGEIALLDVPVPACRSSGVLVRSDFSLISMGTEAMKIHESKLSLIGKARARPDQVKKVIETVTQLGPVATYKKVMNRLDSYTPLGYSLSGVVVAVGERCGEFQVGQRVACGGNQFALHAEYNWVPKNLCVPVPDNVSQLHAAFTTVGAIAMQGFRQSDARLGETACVIGLGLVGQILVQILRAAGVQVVGIDVSKERCELAERRGAAACGIPGDPSFDRAKAGLGGLSGGAGADHIFLTAGGDTNQPVEVAAELARDRARVVDIGKCKLDLPWTAYYEKELDVRFSRSYGPGRYDPNYEERGIDYPIGYVRWTERRNMECVLDLVAAGRLDFDAITSDVVPFDETPPSTRRSTAASCRAWAWCSDTRFKAAPSPMSVAKPLPPAPPRRCAAPIARVRLGVIGCGNYATTMLLPHLKRRDVELVEVATATAFRRQCAGQVRLRARLDRLPEPARRPGHRRGPDRDPPRQSSFMVCEALRAGKAVFVEKPLAVTADQLAAVRETVAETGDRIMVGFNRRFAPILAGLRAAWGGCGGPQIVNYTVNAGPLQAGSWYGQSDLTAPASPARAAISSIPYPGGWLPIR